MNWIVTEFQWSPGYQWERISGISTSAEVRAEFGVDPSKTHLLLLPDPLGRGERIVCFRPA